MALLKVWTVSALPHQVVVEAECYALQDQDGNRRGQAFRLLAQAEHRELSQDAGLVGDRPGGGVRLLDQVALGAAGVGDRDGEQLQGRLDGLRRQLQLAQVGGPVGVGQAREHGEQGKAHQREVVDGQTEGFGEKLGAPALAVEVERPVEVGEVWPAALPGELALPDAMHLVEDVDLLVL